MCWFHCWHIKGRVAVEIPVVRNAKRRCRRPVSIEWQSVGDCNIFECCRCLANQAKERDFDHNIVYTRFRIKETGRG